MTYIRSGLTMVEGALTLSLRVVQACKRQKLKSNMGHELILIKKRRH